MSETRDSAKAERRELHYWGRVQGVGFRYVTRQIAGRFAVSGFVQNLFDGRVLLVAEGTPAVVDGFVAAVNKELGRYISGVETTTKPASGEFSGFEIRH